MRIQKFQDFKDLKMEVFLTKLRLATKTQPPSKDKIKDMTIAPFVEISSWINIAPNEIS